ncbi:site-specific DNA-methyltransferase (adenine-specific) [Silvibacterium bohemicum]|uniref:Methyltransferase n=1 Tax=Silvibacterium bohemicum TaxID=1577686 RepID=A0A841K1N8_9BACT|nr:DNA methyltransferase [Silvibacterium bohemicum]MBB6147320.1 site-specific DNA-methyltransferase (adenine-specific) [Silvibacterium bohemicum]
MNTNTIQQQLPVNAILHGDCIEKMHEMPANSADFILTDPPYLVNYRDRDGRTIQNDANADWLKPAMREAYRVLKMNRVAIMFYSWTKVDEFFAAWKDAGFQPVGHIVFRKTYSSKSRFLSYRHEQAYLLAKGRPPLPKQPVADVIDMPYSGNKLHPTQKPVEPLAQLIRSFTLPGELVLDPFAGSGSTCAAALLTGRKYRGVELDDSYYEQAVSRMNRVTERISVRRSSSSFPRPVDGACVPACVKANYSAAL